MKESYTYQHGTAMIVTLLLLIVMTLIVLASSRNSTLQLRMASNMEARIVALQNAQSALDNVIAKYDAADFTNDDVYICTVNHKSSRCNPGTFSPKNPKFAGMPIELDNDLFETDVGGTSWVEIEQLGDIQLPGLSADIGIKGASSKALYGTVYYVRSGFDGTETGQGRAEIIMGALKFSR